MSLKKHLDAISFIAFTLVLFVLAALSFHANGRFLGIDDAHIFFGYAENICKGNGITYSNSGVVVEGYTSTLWLLICTLNFWLGLNEVGVLLVGIVLLVAAQKLWVDVLDLLVDPTLKTSFIGKVAYYAMILSSVAYITWMTITLMDVVLWGFLLAWMTKVFVRAIKSESIGCMDAIPFLLAPFCRPEAMFVCPVNIGLLVVYRLIYGKPIRRILILGLVFLVSLLAITVFRLAYFGYPFPNTYYAKVSPSAFYNLETGLQYLLRFLTSGVVPFVFMACLIVKGMRCLHDFSDSSRRMSIDHLDFMWLWAAVLFLQPILTGGDHFLLSRFYQGPYPLFCILLITAFLPYVRFSGTRWQKIVLVLEFSVFLFASWEFHSSWPYVVGYKSKIAYEFELAREGMMGGRMFSVLFRDVNPRPTIGVIGAGGIARTYDGKIEDMMGLNNLMVAHFKGDRKGFKNHAAFEVELFDRMDVDVMPFKPIGFGAYCVKGLCSTDAFVASWRYGELRRKDDPKAKKSMLISKRFLNSLLETGKFEFRDTLAWNGSEWTQGN